MKVGSLGEGQGLCPSYHGICGTLALLVQDKGATETDRLDEVFSEETVCKEHTAVMGRNTEISRSYRLTRGVAQCSPSQHPETNPCHFRTEPGGQGP